MACHCSTKTITVCRKGAISVTFFLIFPLLWEASLGWKWKTSDAIIHDVWPERSSSSAQKLKRASARSIDVPRTNQLFVRREHENLPVSKSVGEEETEDGLIFDGHYFKPNEASLPPPPPFMVMNSNWRGSVGINQVEEEHKESDTLYKQQMPSSYFVVGVGKAPSALSSSSQKFTADNVQTPNEISVGNLTEEKIHSSSNASPKTVSFHPSKGLELPTLEEIHYYEEKDLELLESFKDAPKCYTPTDTEGRCVTFRKCFPVVFNVIDGELRNPGLAKLLYQASGPCNATLELEFAFRKLNNEKMFHEADFYNQSVCCPGFKHPPEPVPKSPWPAEEPRSARLILYSHGKDGISSSTSDVVDTTTQVSKTDPRDELKRMNEEQDDLLLVLTSTERPVEDNESSIEDVETELGSNRSSHHEGQDQDSILEITEDDDDDGYNGEEEFGDIVLVHQKITENGTTDSDGNFEKEERRGDRDKVDTEGVNHKTRISDAMSAVPAPNLAPMTCRQQIYGMPRGHWPWMVALVISSRHICSGALIDEKHVVTGSHCVFLLSEADVKRLRVIIGDRVMYSSVDGPHFWRKVSRIITHANYNQQTFASDIAILKLNSPVPFSRNIQPITLPDSYSVDTSLIYRKGIVAGWSGADIGQPAFEARTEIETVVDIMDKVECHEIYRGFALSGLSANTFCTKPVNNTCVADSGAPLIVRSQDCWILQGIMSWGIGCSHFPEVYTDVAKFTPWIRKHLK